MCLSMYFLKLSRFREKCSPSLTTFIVFGTSKVNLSVINGGDKSYVEYQRFARAKMRVNSR